MTSSAVLQDKVAVITGGTRGLGLEIARAYAARGANVVIASRSAESVSQALDLLGEAGLSASGVPSNVADRQDVERLAAFALATYGRLDIWVNNAALTAPYGPVAAIHPEVFAEILQTNILGVYYGSWVAINYFLQSRRGKLINILGEGARKPRPLQTAYSSTKAWVRSFTQALASEYKETGIGVFAFNPGLMETQLVQNVTAIQGYEDRLKPFVAVRQLFSQSPSVPAQKAVWLASSASDGKTGLEVRQMTIGKTLAGLLHFLTQRVTGKPLPEIKMVVTTIPPYNQNKHESA
jgi:glucose 1-dehydrogenase